MNQQNLFSEGFKEPVVVAYGLGVDSTAMLVGLINHKERPDLILFADVGGEVKATYDYLPIIQKHLKKHGFPPVTVVRYVPKDFKNWPPYYTLEDNCLTNGTLPGISFGPASCSVKWKQAPQHTYVKQWAPAIRAWSYGKRVVKLIGFDNGTRDRCRTYSAEPKDSHLYDYQTPLQKWGWDREECLKQIAAAGLPLPVKSACWFCLAMKPDEVRALPADKLKRIVRMEARAHPRLRTTEGLWRKSIKGARDITKKRPGSMTQFIREEKLLPGASITKIWNNTPKEIILYQTKFAEAKAAGKGDEFLKKNQKDYRSQKEKL